MKYLIVGLGNIGADYEDTRHNVGFKVLEAFAKASNTFFEPDRYGDICRVNFKGRTLVLVKPSTYVNLSGKAVNYWLQKEKLSTDRLMVVMDDLALPFGTLRLKAKGGDGGHNGLKDINRRLGRNDYPRLRIGIGDEFSKGSQVNYVLGKWSPDEEEKLPAICDQAIEMIKGFSTIGVNRTMSEFNNKKL